jgi:uncharacterized protein YkwD
MKRTTLLALGLIAVLANATSAQNTTFQNQTASSVAGSGNDVERPRVIADRDAEVKASVIVNTAAVERSAFELLNKKREENGLKRLVWNDDVAKVARQHSQNMAEFKYFSHRGLDDSMVSDRADRSGLVKWSSIGENIAFNRGYKDPIEVAVRLWIESPSHRRNLLNSEWRESAVGIAVAEDGSYYFTQVFLLRAK